MTYTGTPAAETVQASDADDVIYGRGGADVICAYQGEDEVYGGKGEDDLWGESGADWLKAEARDRPAAGGARPMLQGRRSARQPGSGPGLGVRADQRRAALTAR